MKISKYELCSSCRKISPVMSNGSTPASIEEMLDSPGYNQPGGDIIFNQIWILPSLQNFGGCSSCIRLVERLMNS